MGDVRQSDGWTQNWLWETSMQLDADLQTQLKRFAADSLLDELPAKSQLEAPSAWGSQPLPAKPTVGTSKSEA